MYPFPEADDPGREALLARIKHTVAPDDPLFWAFGTIGDMEELWWLVNATDPSIYEISGPTTWTTILRTWIHRETIEYTIPMCEQRDNYTCLLTGATDPEDCQCPTVQATPICRFAERVAFTPVEFEVIDTFWERLYVVFNEGEVTRWWQACAEADTSSVLHNMLCLSERARRLWREGWFSLKPVDSPPPTDTSLTVELYWIWRRNNEGDLYRPTLFNRRTSAYICSGDSFTLETDDPDMFPLPSVDLLNMQWALTRVVGLAKATLGPYAEALLDTEGDESDEGDWDETLEEGEIAPGVPGPEPEPEPIFWY